MYGEPLAPMNVFEIQSGLTRSLIFLYHAGVYNVTPVISMASIHEHQVYPQLGKLLCLALLLPFSILTLFTVRADSSSQRREDTLQRDWTKSIWHL